MNRHVVRALLLSKQKSFKRLEETHTLARTIISILNIFLENEVLRRYANILISESIFILSVDRISTLSLNVPQEMKIMTILLIVS